MQYRRRRPDLADLPPLTWGRLRGLRRMLRDGHPRAVPEAVAHALQAIVLILEERATVLPPEIEVRSMTPEELRGRDKVGEPTGLDWPVDS